jgi:hypothetical protein
MRFVCLCILVVLCATLLFVPAFGVINRVSRAAEEMAKKLPEHTKKMVHAMDASGMPRDAIADRIKYAAGGNKAHASRLVDAVKAEAARDAKKKRK